MLDRVLNTLEVNNIKTLLEVYTYININSKIFIKVFIYFEEIFTLKNKKSIL